MTVVFPTLSGHNLPQLHRDDSWVQRNPSQGGDDVDGSPEEGTSPCHPNESSRFHPLHHDYKQLPQFVEGHPLDMGRGQSPETENQRPCETWSIYYWVLGIASDAQSTQTKAINYWRFRNRNPIPTRMGGSLQIWSFLRASWWHSHLAQ